MTQALNLANFANNLNTSGQTSNSGLQNNSITINTTSPITGGATPALGGSMTIAHANSGVTAASYTNANITVNAQGHITAASNGSSASGTVTSVATGNGLQGGTITSSGTLSVACPTFNTVGSYCWIYFFGGSPSAGANYSAGGSFQAGLLTDVSSTGCNFYSNNILSGTWKWMSSNQDGHGSDYNGLACRVA